MKSMISLHESQKLELKSFTLGDLKLFYVTLLIVDIGVNDIENITARHNVVFSSFQDNKTFFHKTDEKEE